MRDVNSPPAGWINIFEMTICTSRKNMLQYYDSQLFKYMCFQHILNVAGFYICTGTGQTGYVP